MFQSLRVMLTDVRIAAADSVSDPLANLLLNLLHRKSKRVDLNKYPGVCLVSFEASLLLIYLFTPSGWCSSNYYR